MKNVVVVGVSNIDFVFLFSIGLDCVADTAVKKRVEDIMPIATGHEREELAVELEVVFPLCLALKCDNFLVTLLFYC